MNNFLIAISVAIPFMGYILFSDSFNQTQAIETPTDTPSEVVASEQTLFVPSGYRRLEESNEILLDVDVKGGALQSIWAIYDKEADSLTMETPHQSSELGMGSADEYGWYSIIISSDKLEPGISYFYRIVGETPDGKVLYSGLNRFTAGK